MKTAHLWPQLARHPASPKSLGSWDPPGRLHAPRVIRVGPWVIDDDGEFVWLWTASEVAALERLPRAVHDGNPWLRGRTVAEMVEAIDKAAAGWSEIESSLGLETDASWHPVHAPVPETDRPKPRPARKHKRPIISVRQAAWEGLKALGDVADRLEHDADCGEMATDSNGRPPQCTCRMRRIDRTIQRIVDALDADPETVPSPTVSGAREIR